MKCSCGGDTAVLETRTLDGIFRRKRKCKVCSEVFFTKEAFLYKAGENPNLDEPHNRKHKQLYTKPEAAVIKQKKVDIRRRVEDIKHEKKSRVPSYFIEEEDW